MRMLARFSFRRIRSAAVLAACLLACVPQSARAQEESDEFAIRRCQRLLKERPFAQIEDSLARIAVNEIVPRNRWRSQELYLLGAAIGEKSPSSFLGPFLRGLYFSAVSTDRRGHERARRELTEAWRTWPRTRYAPEHGNLDAMLTGMARDGVPLAEQQFRYNLTHSYLQLNYQLSQEHLELNEAREAYTTIRTLMEEDFAFDFYSLNKLSWMFYKYRYFAPGTEYPFLKNSFTANIDAALASAFAAQRKIDAYLAAKPSHTRYWQDDGSIRWYTDATTNLISIAYGVRWQTDSAIVYYEKMPDYMKLRNNGQIIYLSDLNYRAAEYQFEMVGMAGGQPVNIVSEPGAIEPYKTLLICKGVPGQTYAFLDNFTKKYHEQRGIGLISTGTANYWNGHLDDAARNLALAADYPEVFGYTSFTRTHYEAMLRSQQGAVYEAMAHRLDFEPALSTGFFARLWERLTRLIRKLVYTFMSFLARHWATDKYLQFEDRREFLKPWYTENPLDYYQFWTILRRLDPSWHLARLREARASDTRPRAARYYTLYEAGFLHARGDDAAAHRLLAGNGRPLWESVDTAYEKLLGAMAIDLDIAVTGSLGREEERRLTVELYRRYPQTVLLWGHRLPLAFRNGDVNLGLVSPDKRGEVETMLDTFRNFDFDFSESDPGIPTLRLSVEQRGDMLRYPYQVLLNGSPVATGIISSERKQDGAIVRLTPNEIAKELAYGVFRIVPRQTAL